jgi:hypothetical protein
LSVNWHEPVAPERVATHECVPSEIVTDPVGTPAPGETGAIVTFTLNGWPVTAGVIEVMVVVVAAGVTL